MNNRVVVFIAVTLLVIVSVPVQVQAQATVFGESFPIGSLAGTGNCDAMWAGRALSLSKNPAHVVWGSGWSAAGGYRRLYQLEYLQRTWGAANYSDSTWGIGITVTRFGKEEFYTETEAGFAFGWRVQRNVAVGVELNNLRLAYTPDLRSYSGWTAGLGTIYQPVSDVTVTGSIHHVWREHFINGYDLPRTYNVSAAAHIPGDVYLGIGWEKTEGDRDILGLGQKIRLAGSFTFLSAVYFEPARYALGGEFTVRGQSIHYCYLSHPELGGTHYIEFEIVGGGKRGRLAGGESSSAP